MFGIKKTGLPINTAIRSKHGIILVQTIETKTTVMKNSTTAIIHCAKHYKSKAMALLLLGLTPSFINAGSMGRSEVNPDTKLPAQTISFIENLGQVKDQFNHARPDVLFSGSSRAMVYHLRDNGISYQLSRVSDSQREIYRLDVNWLNINPSIKIQTDEASGGYDNFYKDAQPILNVKTYKGIVYRNMYNNIDLHYYEKNGDLKYDYIVSPHADYKQIQLEIKGAETIQLQNDGSIIFKTPFGSIQEGAPLVFQNNKKIKAVWKIIKNILSFDIPNYDPDLPLLIDPATRVWGTYYGAAQAQFLGTNGAGCTTDASGNVYFVGLTDAAGTGIATTGSHQSALSSGFGDGFLVKFNSAGVRQWGTYYGGSGGSSNFNACAIDPATGDIYAVGLSSSTSGIATPGSHQAAAVSNGDGMLVKFNNAGVRQWGTYYGDAGTDGMNDVEVDGSGNIYVVGKTFSSSGISTTGSHQAAYSGGTAPDAFLVKFNSTGVRQWGTYYGSTGLDYGNAVALDATGNVYMGGETSSTSNISTPGSYQVSIGAGADDGFLVKFNSSGVRQWGTYYGGSGIDLFNGCDINSSGDIFLTGQTSSSSGIATVGAYQTVYGGGTGTLPHDAFVVKFNSSGIPQWGTYFGGSGNDEAVECATDSIRQRYYCWPNKFVFWYCHGR